jgi:division protein CdvB (Snf7/Vps24/ESCRT-III family)
MRYKNNVMQKLEQAEALLSRIQLQVNRGMAQDSILESVEALKGQLENVKDTISVEPDDFEQQFAPQR